MTQGLLAVTPRFIRAAWSLALAGSAVGFPLQGQQTTRARDRDRIAAAVDSIAAQALRDGKAAGMSVAVVWGRDTVVLKGYGYADLELDVPTPERAIYEVGSITKQFTAAAIFKLAEEGKLTLDDEITEYLPDFPTRGHRITLRHLLNHTSGIPGYTEFPEFAQLSLSKLPRDSLVALIASKPLDFPPGEAMVYSNSGYFLLGLVIEKASGLPYEEYVRRHLFAPSGMEDSRYCSERAVIKRRAHGYDMGPLGLMRAAYLDHTWPYAAGSLCSTAWDLVAWNQALHGGKILAPDSYRELIAPDTLNDGTRLRYAKGLVVDSMFGRRVIHHGGGINGFLSDLKYFPDDTLTVAVLINTLGPVAPAQISRSIAEVIFGAEPEGGIPFSGAVADYAGIYRGVGRGRELVIEILADSARGGLAARIGEGELVPLVYLGGETFERGSARLKFEREGGKVVALRADLVSVYSILRRSQ
jgi:CubicO group peptidase (beta-lactamase class C family)